MADAGGHVDRRSADVWRRLVGLFGGDSVKRKFGNAIPPEWPALLAQLTEMQLERGMRRLVYSGRDQVPSLPAFLKLCRSLDDSLDPPARPQFTALPSHADGFDPWELAANRHLLAHVLRRTQAGYTDGIEVLVEAKKAWASDMRDLARNGPVVLETQRAVWDDYLAGAERRVNADREGEPA